MNNADVHLHLDQCRIELNHIRDSITALGIMSQVAPYLTKYAVIRACGAIEVSFKNLIVDFCSKRSKKQVKRYIFMKIAKGSANPSQDKILSILNEFDEDWKKVYKANLKADPDRQQLLDSLQSLVDARNDFAHGGNPTLSISDVLTHFTNAQKVIEHVDSVIL
jgi:hypothetical protein